ncbi:hypothetical protein Leryth_022058 [Lithospermum erythrorhizon]|nr:hypothetical protein Leryth_022058 [Lithospermum erythrorhizon]
MQSSFTHIVEDHDHSSDVALMAKKFEYLVRLNEDLDTQKSNIEDQEPCHDVGHQKVARTEDYEAKTEDYAAKTGDFEAKTEDSEEKTEDYEALTEDNGEKTEDFEAKKEDYEEETDYVEEEFSFTFKGSNESLIAAEDAFVDGKIKPLFPLFNQDLLLQDQYFEENLTHNPKVTKVLFQMNKDSLNKDSLGNDEISLKTHIVRAKAFLWIILGGEHERCKKSNSTGFSKLWRLKEVVNRSNSDGRDAFVFLKSGKDGDKMIKGGKNKTTSSNHQNGVKKMVLGGGGGGVGVVVVGVVVVEEGGRVRLMRFI